MYLDYIEKFLIKPLIRSENGREVNGPHPIGRGWGVLTKH
jgi:hypothetical protein